MLYLDSSAIVKLVLPEVESAALRLELSRDQERCSSALARVEVFRAVRGANASIETLGRAAAVLERIALMPLDDRVLSAAAELDPPGLRSLDSIHLATALSLFGLSALVAYDQRLLAAAGAAGLPTLAPA
ncbi:MAG: type II toxin-antitoxin system VapC family toxin [Acidobacteriota bacterium]|nr:type II toxin-antitoxin system VapC family toxin [Acidobacteriota bacterium]